MTTAQQERLVVNVSPLELGQVCFDETAPFPVTHAGKLTIPTGTDEEYYPEEYKPPRNHCVVQQNDGSGLAITRFTPQIFFNALCLKLGTVDLVAELHERHLKNLDKLGLHPWFEAVASGSHPNWDDGGIYVLQDLLPQDAQIGITGFNDLSALAIRVSQYHNWVRDNNEPAYLADIERGDQVSKIGSMIVLHDIEPLYSTVIP